MACAGPTGDVDPLSTDYLKQVWHSVAVSRMARLVFSTCVSIRCECRTCSTLWRKCKSTIALTHPLNTYCQAKAFATQYQPNTQVKGSLFDQMGGTTSGGALGGDVTGAYIFGFRVAMYGGSLRPLTCVGACRQTDVGQPGVG